MKLRVLAGVFLLAILFSGCRGVYYSTWEKFGVYKRDLLKKKVEAARDEEKAAGEQFKDALTRLKELYGFQGGDLEKTYNTLNHDYERSVERANAVHKRIKEVESVAEDLFTEWEKELKQIFTKFYRTKKAQASGEAGTGIGLSIVQQIVTHHGGKMEVTSRPGMGSCFTMILPCEEIETCNVSS